MNRLGQGVLVVLAATTVTTMQPDRVSAVPLQNLIATPGSVVVVGDLVFNNFGFAIMDSGGWYIADPTRVDVQILTTGNEYALRFSGLIGVLSNMAPSSHLVVSLDYEVRSVLSNWDIEAISLAFNGAGTTPDSLAQVLETVISENTIVGEAMVTSPSTPPYTDREVFAGGPHGESLYVRNRIMLDGGGSGVVTISFINNTFSQVPEPASLMLLALVGVTVMRRRRG
jgi:hypothetical protein